jgi:pyruvate formate lyase activating enzyme
MHNEQHAMIFDVQRFSLHDGPGIRTTVFFKGCPLRCAWCQNPESRKAAAEMAYFTTRCIHCGACLDICPEHALRDADSNRIMIPQCTACGMCMQVCPSGALRLIGREWGVRELYDELIRDREFFLESGGGVTFSGGEPLLHHRFLKELCALLKENGIHQTVETCGIFSWDDVVPLIPFINLVYFDLKLIDERRHCEWTGRDNGLILENFSRAAQSGVSLQARIPVMTGVNNDRDNIVQTARVLLANGLDTIHCLPGHNLGSSKWDSLGEADKAFRCPPADSEVMGKVRSIFLEEGIDANIIG